MSVIVRFAPSPTGYLHIGGARTALFNWLFAKHHKGQFLLRIEDTDRERSTQEAVDKIFESMKWLELDWDGDVVFQFARASRHAEVAHQLLKEGKAYYCYCTPEELDKMREEAKENGLPPRYNGYWRDRNPQEAPSHIKPVIRFKAPKEGETLIHDLVQGPVRINNSQLDDMVLLRSDGTPTYMLSVVVDDHDMNITHIIRGDDHLTNAFRQKQLYLACGWNVPEFAHIPLIHGQDGAKLSKRHGAVGAEYYQEMGYLPEAMRNYLLRLGWGHGDEEIISTEKAIEWFTLNGVGRSAARFDMAKLTNLNAHYIRHKENESLLNGVIPFIEKEIKRSLLESEKNRIFQGLNGLKERAKTLVELAEGALIYIKKAETLDEKAKKFCSETCQNYIRTLYEALSNLDIFDEKTLEDTVRNAANDLEIKLGDLAQPLRVALTNKIVSPSLFEVMAALGREETLARINDYLSLKV